MARQAIAILPKIEEIDRVMCTDLTRQEWIVEVHPELCFLTLAKGLRVEVPAKGLPAKKNQQGRIARQALLRRVFRDIEKQLAIANTKWPRTQVRPDDIPDAYAALWTARRRARPSQRIVHFGEGVDAEGLLQRMIA
jgi:predicted RNase H-like nuclease